MDNTFPGALRLATARSLKQQILCFEPQLRKRTIPAGKNKPLLPRGGICIGSRVVLLRSGARGEIKFIGLTKFGKGEFYGVDLDADYAPGKGRKRIIRVGESDGTVECYRYFKAKRPFQGFL